VVVRRIRFPERCASSEHLAIALGNYDGLHLGHQYVLKELCKHAASNGLLPGLLTFYPHPRDFFGNGVRSPLLRVSQRARLVGDLGIKKLLAVRFDSNLARLTGPEFLSWLVDGLGVRFLIVGEDARIGRDREMEPQQMREFLSARGAQLQVVGDLKAGTERVSATQVRVAVQSGDVLRAYSFLGRAYSLTGRVIRGDGRGSGIGVPTINLSPPRQLLPGNGVYVTRAIVSGKSYPAVTNIGVRPTFNGSTIRVESHLLDGPYPKMYGERAEICFIERLRPERRFDTVNDLISAIRADISIAREKHGLKK
jgi:riboflavin kinase/FMN adenylyltransferase